MTHNLYIAAVEPRSGKSLVALGVMQLLSREIDALGFFRPVVRAPDEPDNDIELIRTHYCPEREYDELVGVPHDDARQMAGGGDYDALLKQVFERFKQLEQKCQFVLCEGTDYTGIASAFEFEFNAKLANHLGCAVLLVTSGRGKTMDEVVAVARTARDAFRDEGCTIAATMINRVEPSQIDQLKARLTADWRHPDPVFVLREETLLASPTVAEIGRALNARQLHGEQEGVNREVRDCKIAAMHMANYLEYVTEGALIITPGDRADVILASLTTLYSDNYPDIAGIILTGGIMPSDAVRRLVDGFKLPSIPTFLVDDDTYSAAMKVNSVRGSISPQNERKIAAALGVFEASVDGDQLKQRIAVTRSTRVTPLMFEYELVRRAKAHPRRIVLPEGTESRILRAAEILERRGVVKVILLGHEREIRERAREIGIDAGQFAIIDPASSPWHDEFAAKYIELRKHKGVTDDYAHDVMHDVSYFGTMMVYLDRADGMVSGSVNTTAHTIRPAFEIIRARAGVSIVSSVFFMCLEDRVLVYGDCAVNPNPDPRQLADIAISSAETAANFGIEPRVAMLSYSSGASGRGEEVDKVREATRIARELRPDLQIDGPIQYDAAIDAGVAKKKMPDSQVAGRATVYVFPDLNAGNNTYKAVQRSAGAVAVGPVLQGLNKPVNDLSRGCTVKDIVNTVAITAIQAQRVAGLD